MTIIHHTSHLSSINHCFPYQNYHVCNGITLVTEIWVRLLASASVILVPLYKQETTRAPSTYTLKYVSMVCKKSRNWATQFLFLLNLINSLHSFMRLIFLIQCICTSHVRCTSPVIHILTPRNMSARGWFSEGTAAYIASFPLY